ncbi:hypothetical protein VKT23_014962 [Stygiomarasmius scandens]|uniref:Uncharacterized protein n=1 Tax=Marasmiellus scandens TaxID=2682957 RepID=A0ABR1IZ50_9AGAR
MVFRSDADWVRLQSMREKYEEAMKTQHRYQQDLDVANSKMKKLQEEVNLLLEAMLEVALQDPTRFAAPRQLSTSNFVPVPVSVPDCTRIQLIVQISINVGPPNHYHTHPHAPSISHSHSHGYHGHPYPGASHRHPQSRGPPHPQQLPPERNER